MLDPRARRSPAPRARDGRGGDQDAAALWADLRRQRRAGTASIAANLAAKTTLRCEQQVLADMLFTLPPDAYYRLVHEEGWPAEKFHGWLADLLQRVCLP